MILWNKDRCRIQNQIQSDVKKVDVVPINHDIKNMLENMIKTYDMNSISFLSMQIFCLVKYINWLLTQRYITECKCNIRKPPILKHMYPIGCSVCMFEIWILTWSKKIKLEYYVFSAICMCTNSFFCPWLSVSLKKFSFGSG